MWDSIVLVLVLGGDCHSERLSVLRDRERERGTCMQLDMQHGLDEMN